jgi:hypothetical protein
MKPNNRFSFGERPPFSAFPKTLVKRKIPLLATISASTTSPRLFWRSPYVFLRGESLARFFLCRGVPLCVTAEALLAPSGSTFVVLTCFRASSESTKIDRNGPGAGCFHPFFGRRNFAKYIIWNLLTQTFKQNAQYITFFGPSVIKSPNESGCQGCVGVFWSALRGAVGTQLQGAKIEIFSPVDEEYAAIAGRVDQTIFQSTSSGFSNPPAYLILTVSRRSRATASRNVSMLISGGGSRPDLARRAVAIRCARICRVSRGRSSRRAKKPSSTARSVTVSLVIPAGSRPRERGASAEGAGRRTLRR